jgi:hypothetical protein
MKKKLIQWLTRWLERLTGLKVRFIVAAYIEIPEEFQKLVDEAKIWVVKFDSAPQSGEWKRHQVLAILRKLCPDRDVKDLALAIEYAVRSR